MNNKQERRQQQIHGIIKAAALRHWPSINMVDAQIIDAPRTDMNWIDYKRGDGQHEGVMLQFIEIPLGQGEVLPVSVGYCGSDNVLLVEELESNYAVMLFTLFGEEE